MRRTLASALLLLLALVLGGCVSNSAPAALAVGAGPAPESVLLGHLYAAALRYYGTPTLVRSSPSGTRITVGHPSAGAVTVPCTATLATIMRV